MLIPQYRARAYNLQGKEANEGLQLGNSCMWVSNLGPGILMI